MDISFFTRQSLNDSTRVNPESPALGLENGTPISYEELAIRARKYANALLAIDVAPGDRVGILLYNCVEYWLAYFAITRLGAIAVRLNFRLQSEELSFAIQDSGSSVLLAESSLVRLVEPLRHKLTVKHYVTFGPEQPDWALDWRLLEEADDVAPNIALPAPTDPAMIMYTSGTTGRPKGALWTHSTTAWWTAMQQMEWNFSDQSVTMVTGPLYHIGALENYSLPTLAAGGRVILLRSGGFDIERTLRIAGSQGVTDILLFPSMIYRMLQARESLRDVDLSQMRRIFTGGDTLLPTASKELLQQYEWIDVVQVYGLTEGTPVAACGAPNFARSHPDSVGLPFPFCELSIRDDNGISLPSENSGEIWTRSPANAVGYWQNAEATSSTFVDGWCKTGDLGVIEDGYLRIVGRKKDMIRSGGENIYPAEIEDVLLRHPDIVDAAVIGVPDETYIESVCAVVVLAPGVEMPRQEIIGHCAKLLAGFKKPRRVEFVTEIPRTPSAKIMKYKLRETYR